MPNKNFKKQYLFILFFGLAIAGVALVLMWQASLMGVNPLYCAAMSKTQTIMGENLSLGRGFTSNTQPPYERSITYMPGYPVLLALSWKFFHSYLPLIILQLLTLPAIGILIFKIGSLFTQNNKFLLAVSGVSMMEPGMWYYRGCIQAEAWLALFFLSIMWFFLRFLKSRSLRDLCATSFLIAISIYIKAVMMWFLLIPLAFLIYYLIASRRYAYYLKLIFFCLLIFIAVIVPWSLRNRYHFGTFRLTNAESYSFYLDAAPTILGMAEGKSAADIREEFYAGMPRTKTGRYRPGYDSLDADTYLKDKTIKVFTDYPLQSLRVFSTGVFNYFVKTEWAAILERWDIVHPAERPSRSLFGPGFGDGTSGFWSEIVSRFSCGWGCVITNGAVFAGRSIWLLITIFSFVGIFNLFKKGYRSQSVFFLFAIFYFALTYGLLSPTGTDRYRVFLVPILVFLAFWGIKFPKETID